MNKIMKNSFLSPPDIYRGTDFWMLNDALSDDEIRRQISEMHDKGIWSFIARTYIGLKSDYPGPGFRSSLRTIVDCAKEHDMKVFLQAGYMPEAVIDLPPEYALYYLISYKSGEAPEGAEVVASFDGYDVASVNSVTFLNMFLPEAVQFYIKQSYEDMWADFRDEFGKTIISIWVDEPSYGRSGMPWMPQLPELFRERWGFDILPHIESLYNDLPESSRVRYCYRVLIAELLENAYFRMVREWCNANGVWFSGHLMMEDTMTGTIARAAHTMPYYKYFDIPGIDRLTAGMNWRNMEIKEPGGRIARRHNAYTTPLQCTSAAHQSGAGHILAEMYGVTSQNMAFREQRCMFDSYAVMGINHRSVHGIFYSLHGRGKRAFPVHVNYYQPYWKDYRRMTDYVCRTSWFISQGRPVRDIAVVHPMYTAYMYEPASLPGRPKVSKTGRLDCAFYDLLFYMSHDRLDFELVDEKTMADWGCLREGGIGVGKMTYRTMVFPYMETVDDTTLALVRKLSASGGEIFFVGRFPDRICGELSDTLADELAGLPGVTLCDGFAELARALKNYRPNYLVDCADASPILCNHRADGDTHYYMLYNSDCAEGRTGRFILNGSCRVTLYDAADGNTRALPAQYDAGNTFVDIEIPEGSSILLRADGIACNEAQSEVHDKPLETVRRLSCRDFEYKRHEDNCMLLEFAEYKAGDAPYSPLIPVMAIHEQLTAKEYRGPLTLRFTFTSEKVLTGLKLALEDAEQHEIFLNGERAENIPEGYYFSRSFETVKLPDSCRVGENELLLKREFLPLSKYKSAITSLFEHQKGCELESAYLLGDFAVIGQPEPTFSGCLRYDRRFILGDEYKAVGSELTSAGYPFYTGSFELTTNFNMTADELAKPEVVLRTSFINAAIADVAVNGKSAGKLLWAPYEIDIRQYLNEGVNNLTLTLTNTLRNLLGPYHRPEGEVGNLFGGGYTNPNKPWTGGTTDSEWFFYREPDTAEWAEGYLQQPFGIGALTIVSR